MEEEYDDMGGGGAVAKKQQPVALTPYHESLLRRFFALYEPAPFGRTSIDLDRVFLRRFFNAEYPIGVAIDPVCQTADPLTPYLDALHSAGFLETPYIEMPTICVKEKFVNAVEIN